MAVDLCDADAVRCAIRDARPDVIYHLAALSSVARSWDDPARTLSENVTGAINLLEAIRREAAAARVVWVSSCEVYGVPSRLPIEESAPLAPASPYAISKATGEQLAVVYANVHGLDIVRARPFSHSGPGQSATFLLSSLARQAAEGRRAGLSRFDVVTGNPDTRRDFTDVRDVVRAYRLLAELPETMGAVYNLSSGRSASTAELVSLVGNVVAPVEVEHVVDPARVRASEVMELRGDNSLLSSATGWHPTIPLRQTIIDTVGWWEHELAA